MIRWQKRRGFDTPPHVVQYVGGSEDTSGRVWSREKDRGANPPAGKSPPSDCQNLVLKKATIYVYMYAY